MGPTAEGTGTVPEDSAEHTQSASWRTASPMIWLEVLFETETIGIILDGGATVPLEESLELACATLWATSA